MIKIHVRCDTCYFVEPLIVAGDMWTQIMGVVMPCPANRHTDERLGQACPGTGIAVRPAWGWDTVDADD